MTDVELHIFADDGEWHWELWGDGESPLAGCCVEAKARKGSCVGYATKAEAMRLGRAREIEILRQAESRRKKRGESA